MARTERQRRAKPRGACPCRFDPCSWRDDEEPWSGDLPAHVRAVRRPPPHHPDAEVAERQGAGLESRWARAPF